MRLPLLSRLLPCVAALAGTAADILADAHVAVVARANADYVERRLTADGQPKVETYVFMEGNHYKGVIRDRSIERMAFRDIAHYLAPELYKQKYLPATAVPDADLLIVVHWGTTRPYVSSLEMTARTSPMSDYTEQNLMRTTQAEGGAETVDSLAALADLANNQFAFDLLEQSHDQFDAETSRSDNITLLGYNEELHKFSQKTSLSEKERTLRFDLNAERYFIILKAYDLKPKPGASKRPLWTMHLNISSPGNNFQTALTRMGVVASRFAGQTTTEVKTIRPGAPTGTVTLAPLVILKDAK